MENVLSSQIKYWKQQKTDIEARAEILPEKKQNRFPFITISREYGCGGYDIAAALVEFLNDGRSLKPEWAAYDRVVLEKISSDMGLSEQLTDTLTSSSRKQVTSFFETTFASYPSQLSVYRHLSETIRTLAANGRVIIVGRGGGIITRDMPKGFNVRVVAPVEWKAERMASINSIKKADAEKLVIKKNAEREKFFRDLVKFDIASPYNYHLVLNNQSYSTRDAARIIYEAFVSYTENHL
ncbi:MAG TPA: cytidylate kinase-like family protein [Spirochaetota bacterium]|nr:cytidylate kinase-like family protein [Spirochaetota bacterium]